MRIDKWLWAARFYKTRSLAQQAIAAGKVKLGGERIKPAQELRAGDRVSVRKEELEWQIVVRALSDKRGSAEVARKLYEETPESLAERQRRQDLRRLSPEPGAARKGRPTKRDRRLIEALSAGGDPSQD
ncbi:MAG: RNA-binding S4 domain-containing protein [Clostridia bacterium]